MAQQPTQKPDSSTGAQAKKFRDLARQLECDESEEAFKEKVVKVARATAPAKPKT